MSHVRIGKPVDLRAVAAARKAARSAFAAIWEAELAAGYGNKDQRPRHLPGDRKQREAAYVWAAIKEHYKGAW